MPRSKKKSTKSKKPKYYDPATFTWGYELEVGDVSRDLDLGELGSWATSETDIVNLKPPYRHIAADPLGLEPPMGGEINTRPTKTIDGQIQRIKDILQLVRDNGEEATISHCVNEIHVHVHVPGLIDDIDALKRLTKYIQDNQWTVIEKCVQYEEHPLMKETKTARRYCKWDMGRYMPDWMCENIYNMATNFEEFYVIQCCGKDGVSRRMPFRYAINTYCLKHMETIEFRCFRASLDFDEIRDCMQFVNDFVNAALNNGPSAEELIEENQYKFPPFIYDHEEYLGWENTKWDWRRRHPLDKVRTFIPVEEEEGESNGAQKKKRKRRSKSRA